MRQGRRKGRRQTARVAEDGKWVLYCGIKHPVIRKPADKPEHELLSPAAIHVDFQIPLPTVFLWLRDGWLDGRGGTLKIDRHEVRDSLGRSRLVRFLRRGDVAKSLAKNDGDARTRFLYQGKWRITKAKAGRELGTGPGSALEEICKDHGLEFEWIKSPVSRRWVLSCLETELLRVRGELDAKKRAPDFDAGGEKLPTIFARDAAKRILAIRGVAEPSRKTLTNFLRTLNKWHRVDCPYLGAKLRGVPQGKRLCVVLDDVEKIAGAIAAELRGDLAEHLGRAIKSDAHRLYGIPFSDMAKAEHRGKLDAVHVVERPSGVRRGTQYPLSAFRSLSAQIKADTERPVPPGWVPTTKLFDLCGVVRCKCAGIELVQFLAQLEKAGEISPRIRKRGNTLYVDPVAFMDAVKRQKGEESAIRGWIMEGRRNRQMARLKKEMLDQQRGEKLTREQLESIMESAKRQFPRCESFPLNRMGRSHASQSIKRGEKSIAQNPDD